MKIRTLQEFQDALDDALAWRKREISSLFREANRPQNEPFARAFIAMLYAHWEGFIKEAARTYCEFINGQRLLQEEAALPLVMLTHRNAITRCAETRMNSDKLQMVSSLMNSGKERVRMPAEGPIITNNLRFEVFADLCAILQVPISPFATSRNFINEELCDRRNAIAHGKFLRCPPSELRQAKDRVVNLLADFKGHLIGNVLSAAYRNSRP